MEHSITQLLASYGGMLWMTLYFPLYILYILWRNKWKVLHSISDSYYMLQRKERNEEILFTLFTFFLGFGLLLQYIHHFLFFPAAMGLFWVGTQTQFRSTQSIKGTIHYVGALLAIVLSLLGLTLNGVYIPLLIMLGGTPLIWVSREGKGDFIWWVEILAFLTIIWGLWIL